MDVSNGMFEQLDASPVKRREVLAAALGLTAALCCPGAQAEETRTITLGVLSDFSGPYAAWGAEGSVLAAQVAAEDNQSAHPGFPYHVNVISADFALKPDIAVAIARKWIDEGVNAILDVPHTASALSVSGLVKGTKAAALMTGSASNDLVTKNCSANMVQCNCSPPLSKRCAGMAEHR